MKCALREYRVEGIETNLNFFRKILDDPDFRKGQFDTSFIEKWRARQNSTSESPALSQTERDFAVLVAVLSESENSIPVTESPASHWKTKGRIEGLRK